MTPTLIKQTRRDAKLTQVKAADMVGVTDRTWQYWEAGTVKMPIATWKLFCIFTGTKTAS